MHGKTAKVSKAPETEFDNFDRTMLQLISVPHEQIKAALDAEKTNKQKKKRKARKPSLRADSEAMSTVAHYRVIANSKDLHLH